VADHVPSFCSLLLLPVLSPHAPLLLLLLLLFLLLLYSQAGQ